MPLRRIKRRRSLAAQETDVPSKDVGNVGDDVYAMSNQVILHTELAKKSIKGRHGEKTALKTVVVFLLFMAVYFTTVSKQFDVTDSYELERSVVAN